MELNWKCSSHLVHQGVHIRSITSISYAVRKYAQHQQRLDTNLIIQIFSLHHTDIHSSNYHSKRVPWADSGSGDFEWLLLGIGRPWSSVKRFIFNESLFFYIFLSLVHVCNFVAHLL